MRRNLGLQIVLILLSILGLSRDARADGFIIDGLTYVKRNRLERWFPKKSVRAVLRQAGVFHAKRNDTPTVEKTIPGIKGKPRYYRINANALGGSSK